MTSTSEPITWGRTLYRGTDHVWQHRRVSKENGVPIVPTSGAAQVRSSFGGEIWVTAVVTIDAEGWVSVSIPEAMTAGAAWDERSEGVWDLEVVVAGQRLRWAMGKIKVSQDVTR